MTCAHIGHDSHVGNHCILANAATLAGHVIIEDYVTRGRFLPGAPGLHGGKVCVYGRRHDCDAGCAAVFEDLFAAREQGFRHQSIGLERRGFSPERIKALQKAFRLLLVSKLNTTQALEKMRGAGRRGRGGAGHVHRTQPARGYQVAMKLGLIAGNGRFPFLLLDAARAQGLPVVVAAIREETDAEIDERAAAESEVTVHWLSLGELSRLIETFQKEGVRKAVMAGQVKHKQIFSSIRPDWRLAKLLLNLRTRIRTCCWARWPRCWATRASS